MSSKLALLLVPLVALAACKGPDDAGADAQAPAVGPAPPVLDEVKIGLPEWDFSSAPVEGVTLELDPTPLDLCDGGGKVVTVRWQLGGGLPQPQVWVQGGSARPKLFAAPNGTQGEATTGPWVDESTVFFLVEGSSQRVLREVRPTAAACG